MNSYSQLIIAHGAHVIEFLIYTNVWYLVSSRYKFVAAHGTSTTSWMKKNDNPQLYIHKILEIGMANSKKVESCKTESYDTYNL